MIRVAIVEDDASCAAEIEGYLHKYEGEKGLRMEIDFFTDGDAIVSRYPAAYDILLMDIELPLMSGMEAAEEIRQMDQDVEIIFITNSPHYAIQGYRVRALDYILKPVNYYAFSQTLNRALERKLQKKEHFLVLNVKGGKQRVSIRRIRYVEVQDHDLTFHMEDGNIQARGTIRDVVEELQEEGFFHCNKGYLINLAYVDGINGMDISIGKDKIPVGRTRKKAFMEAMNRFLSEQT